MGEDRSKARSYESISTVTQLKEALIRGPYTWPGAYPLYFTTTDGGALSFKTVEECIVEIASAIDDEEDNGWRVCGCCVNWEDTELFDDHSDERIESAYGD